MWVKWVSEMWGPLLKIVKSKDGWKMKLVPINERREYYSIQKSITNKKNS